MTDATRTTVRAASPASRSAEAPGRLRARCACGASRPALGRDCDDCRQTKLIGGQARLAIGPSGNRFEREADQVAERVLAGQSATPDGRALVQVQRVGDNALGEAPPEVERVIAAPARGLDADTRGFFEARFGHDFSRVRVHDDVDADRSAHAVGAHAYTVGQNVVFARGQYQPHTPAGRRLLAHELTHTLQQSGGHAAVQREPGRDKTPPSNKIDVAIVLSDGDADLIEGAAYAKTVLRVTDVKDAAAKIKALGVPIGRLFVVSHSNADAKVEFVSSIGTIHWVPIADLAQTLKGVTSIDDVDFRGCKTGNAPTALEGFRQGVGAQSTRGSNCWSFTQDASPLTYDGVDVTQQSQIPKRRQRAFDKGLLEQLANMKSGDGRPVQNCLIGLGKGVNADATTLDKVWQLYWAGKGHLLSSWNSPNFNHDWQVGSICTKDMTSSTKPCAIVEVRAPAATTPAKSDKTGALESPAAGTEVERVADQDAGQRNAEDAG